ncbi:PREDICTED: uncharacterized protein LOC106820648 isoform X2 [Priapulus caudatus]|nr:PREDICTED: uncharacterized protein LOC106820648 isoform X2 [Priapulus caudatus]
MTLCMVKHMKCILVHGAGSFGHGSAKQWGLNLGWKGNQKDPDYPEPLNRVKMGFCITHREVLLLNQMLARELTEHGVQALAQSPVSTWETDYGIVVKHSAEVLARQVELGFIPLLHGDTVFDRSWGCHVLSGDTIVEVLSSAMSVKRVIYLTDVCGVYDKPPEIGRFLHDIGLGVQ